MKQPVTHIFMGKGGVGKSTTSALTAISMARQGKQVLLVSMDPAHNQSDIFNTQLSYRPTSPMPNLSILEIDPDYWTQRYLDDILNQIKRTYAYLTAFNLTSYFNVIKHSPGLEAYALLMVFESLLTSHAHTDCILLDMPPTALALQFLRLPGLSLVWIDHLLKLRREILKKHELITTIRFGKRDIEKDKVLDRTLALEHQYRTAKERFEDPARTRIIVVTNPDSLARAETGRIINALREMNIRAIHLIQNKTDSPVPNNGSGLPRDIPSITLPVCPESLVGMDSLLGYLHKHKDRATEQLAHLHGL